MRPFSRDNDETTSAPSVVLGLTSSREMRSAIELWEARVAGLVQQEEPGPSPKSIGPAPGPMG